MWNNSCSFLKQRFFDEVLETVRRFQKVVRRLLSLPGFSTLIECDTYLPRYHISVFSRSAIKKCPRAYRNSVSECKTRALRYCLGFSVMSDVGCVRRIRRNLKRVDNTFADWQSQLRAFTKSIRCHESMSTDGLPFQIFGRGQSSVCCFS